MVNLVKGEVDENNLKIRITNGNFIEDFAPFIEDLKYILKSCDGIECFQLKHKFSDPEYSNDSYHFNVRYRNNDIANRAGELIEIWSESRSVNANIKNNNDGRKTFRRYSDKRRR